MAAVEKISIAMSSDMLGMVRSAVEGGDYASTSEVIREALREWKSRRVVADPAVRSLDNTPFTLTTDHRRAIAHLCKRYAVKRLALFGSALRGDFNHATSDVDVTVVFLKAPDAASARHYFDLKQGLEDVLGRPVDLVELSAMPDSRLKRTIERTQVQVYGEPEAA
jgi:putative addiction module CopG family antidote